MPDLAAESVAVPVRVEAPPNNLRSRLTSFIGRDEDLKRVCELLGRSRLVTLTGPGGAGKTRLSLESGDQMLAQLADGVWFVELAPIGDPAEVPHTVLTALGLRETAIIAAGRGRLAAVEITDPVDRLAAALGDKRMLILLDNCEHLLDAAAGLADRLLADCPGVRILATSREPLGITGESLWPVEPLALPPVDAPPDEAVTYPAVRLFADRGSAVRPGFTVADRNVAQIVRICRALDGMPLAIELAAARLRALTAEQIAERLDDRFRLLTGGSRTALPRHKTLRAVVEWSWDLLDDAERALWRRLSVFAGSATVESAEAVCATNDDRPDAEAGGPPEQAGRSHAEGGRSHAEVGRSQAEESPSQEDDRPYGEVGDPPAQAGRFQEEGSPSRAEGSRPQSEEAPSQSEVRRTRAGTGRSQEEGGRTGAEAVLTQAEEGRTHVEGSGSHAEVGRSQSEGSPSQEDGRPQGEVGGTPAQAARSRVEEGRPHVEPGRSQAEGSPSRAEGSRPQSEEAPSQSEGGRPRVGTGRSQSEVDRSQSEVSRSRAEVGRSQAEVGRSRVEGGRSRVEAGRSQAEVGRFHAVGGRGGAWEPDLDVVDVFDTLSALVDKSLVLLRGPWTEAGGGGPRYLMLETIKAYGGERLVEAGEEDRLRRAHAEYFLALAETAEAELRGHDQIYWLGRLAAEHDNLHAALRWAASTGDAALAVRFCAALGWYWWLRGHWSEGNEAAAEVLSMPDLPFDQTTAVAAALSGLTSMGSTRDFEEVKSWLRLARDICASLDEDLHPVLRLAAPLMDMAGQGMEFRNMSLAEALFADPDPWVRSMGRFIHGQIAINTGRIDVPDDDFAIALEGFRSVGDRWGTSFVLTAQAELHTWRGEHREAVALYQEALRLVDELGVIEGAVWHINARLANELALIGEQDKAEELLRDAVRAAERYGSAVTLTAIHHQLGEFARRSGDRAEATRRLERAKTLVTSRPAGPPQFPAMIASSFGLLEAAAGDLARARTLHREALEHAVESMDNPIIAMVLMGYADLAEREDDPVRAAELLGIGDGLRGMRDLSIPDIERLTNSLRATLGEKAFTAAYEQGRTIDLNTALAQFGVELPTRAPL